MKIKVTGLGEQIPVKFEEEIIKAKKENPNLIVDYSNGPSFSQKYKVDSPLVQCLGEDFSNIGYGDNGLALIRDVASGKIK